jgi:UDP-N-acetylglucosamine diphosphorylase/glucosamine-1-phosphate N-acetyltransferase
LSLTVILFEDHTAQYFRPLSWSLPVYELPCGMFNLRERVEMATRHHDDVARILMPRGFLQGVQEQAQPDGWTSGVGAARAAMENSERVLFLTSRCIGRHAHLKDLLSAADNNFISQDEDGLTACACSATEAEAILQKWESWDQLNTENGAWTRPSTPVTPWGLDFEAESRAVECWRRLWDRIQDIGKTIETDLDLVAENSISYSRFVFGVVDSDEAEPKWRNPMELRPLSAIPSGVTVLGDQGIWIADHVELDPGLVLDAREGPIVLESHVAVKSHTLLIGPLVIGIGTIVKAGASVGGETAIGPVCRVNGEVAESQLLAFANKQHAGFLGHAIVGSWVNLGADTTNSDLKNNYGMIKVNAGLGPEDTGTRFLGLMMAEHGKSAIGTTFNTATTVGFSANVFAASFPRACIANFSWGDGRGKTTDVERAIETARIVMSRRGAVLTEAHEKLFRDLAEGLK